MFHLFSIFLFIFHLSPKFLSISDLKPSSSRQGLCLAVPVSLERPPEPTTQAKPSNVYGPGLNAQRAPQFLSLWRGSDPLSRTGVALNPERLQGSQQLFPSDPLVPGARQPGQTIGLAHFSMALLRCHRPSLTPSPGAGVGQEKSSTE